MDLGLPVKETSWMVYRGHALIGNEAAGSL